ncbi:PREDICTED: melanoma-associated antigen B16-like [Chrysochloris asiatica]|uniref:Melanoma-associated antigen B16-like n=1 Tax=Chrysochloris asiatica TaxID=185453 RepID=A0A9B0X196_CHRAS|nr:PREDICTED: melanoma-associated antigen B16-like [Chrysochloris asiatica]
MIKTFKPAVRLRVWRKHRFLMLQTRSSSPPPKQPLCTLKRPPTAEASSTSQGSQIACLSSTATTVSSVSKSDDSSSSQEDEESLSTVESVPGSSYPLDEKVALLVQFLPFKFQMKELCITYDGILSSNEGIPKTDLLVFTWDVIFMKDNHVTEEEIWKALNKMGIFSGLYHLIYGEPRKFITKDLVLEMYLQSFMS